MLSETYITNLIFSVEGVNCENCENEEAENEAKAASRLYFVQVVLERNEPGSIVRLVLHGKGILSREASLEAKLEPAPPFERCLLPLEEPPRRPW
jgi:hypothetical protein